MASDVAELDVKMKEVDTDVMEDVLALLRDPLRARYRFSVELGGPISVAVPKPRPPRPVSLKLEAKRSSRGLLADSSPPSPRSPGGRPKELGPRKKSSDKVLPALLAQPVANAAAAATATSPALHAVMTPRRPSVADVAWGTPRRFAPADAGLNTPRPSHQGTPRVSNQSSDASARRVRLGDSEVPTTDRGYSTDQFWKTWTREDVSVRDPCWCKPVQDAIAHQARGENAKGIHRQKVVRLIGMRQHRAAKNEVCRPEPNRAFTGRGQQESDVMRRTLQELRCQRDRLVEVRKMLQSCVEKEPVSPVRNDLRELFGFHKLDEDYPPESYDSPTSD